jgi:hypothetical protein
MPRRTKKKTPAKMPSKRKAPVQYRPKISRQIQMANQKPASCLVRFQGKQKYQCLFQTAANNKSILRIPASFIGDPVIETGTWTPDSSSRFVDTTANFFGKYNHYKVLGARLVVSVKTLVPDPVQQNNCMVFVARVTNTNVYTIATALKDLEDDYAIKSKQWGAYNSTAYRQARSSIGYSPKKQLNLKDIQDNGTIKVSTASYGLSASDNTFFNVILSGELDSVTQGHSSAIVDVKCSYLLAFEEPKSTENAPVAIM